MWGLILETQQYWKFDIRESLNTFIWKINQPTNQHPQKTKKKQKTNQKPSTVLWSKKLN